MEAVGLATAKAHWTLMDQILQAMRKTTFEESCKRPTLQQAIRADKFVWLNLREWHVEGLAAKAVSRQFPLDASFAKIAVDQDFLQILRPIPMSEADEIKANDYGTIFGKEAAKQVAEEKLRKRRRHRNHSSSSSSSSTTSGGREPIRLLVALLR